MSYHLRTPINQISVPTLSIVIKSSTARDMWSGTSIRRGISSNRNRNKQGLAFLIFSKLCILLGTIRAIYIWIHQMIFNLCHICLRHKIIWVSLTSRHKQEVSPKMCGGSSRLLSQRNNYHHTNFNKLMIIKIIMKQMKIII